MAWHTVLVSLLCIWFEIKIIVLPIFFRESVERKKKKLFNASRSYLDYEVETYKNQYAVPSPVLNVSKPRPPSIPEEPEEPTSMEEFASGKEGWKNE